MPTKGEDVAPAFELGIGGPSGGARDGSQLAEAATRAEDLGFAWFGNGEHVMFHNPTSSALINLAFLAGVTSRIRLLSAITLVPLYPAALLAKMAASLAILADGRFELGIGVGGEYPAEFTACGVDVRTRGARTDEAIDVMRAMWTGRQVDHDGRFWQVKGRLQPEPPSPPRIWVAGRSPAAVRRAIRAGDVYMPYLLRPHRLREQIGMIEQRVPIMPYVFLHVDDNGDRARADAAEWVGHMYRQNPETFRELVIAGDADDCAARLAQIRDWGCSGAHITLVCPPGQWLERCDLVGQEILPKLR